MSAGGVAGSLANSIIFSAAVGNGFMDAVVNWACSESFMFFTFVFGSSELLGSRQALDVRVAAFELYAGKNRGCVQTLAQDFTNFEDPAKSGAG